MKKRNGNAAGAEQRLSNPRRFWTVMLLLWGLLLLTLLLNVNIGSVSIRTRDVFSMLWDGLRCWIANVLTRGGYARELAEVMHRSTESQILFSIRIPRMLLAAILGGALSVFPGISAVGAMVSVSSVLGVDKDYSLSNALIMGILI